MMLDLPGSLLKILAPEQANILGQPTQVRVPLIHFSNVFPLVDTAIVPSGQVNELTNSRGEISAEFVQGCVPACGQFAPFLSALH
jgi:hypothetical protein